MKQGSCDGDQEKELRLHCLPAPVFDTFVGQLLLGLMMVLTIKFVKHKIGHRKYRHYDANYQITQGKTKPGI